tara:strand:- start:398 stop:880 length:483 start_codon:yes stop_codon:yes gene_type:complete
MSNISHELEYLVNPVIYEKFLAKQKKVINTKDKKFYKKRIVKTTKDLFNDNNTFPPSLKSAFDEYLKIVITYLKIEDKKDFMQEEYNNLVKKQVRFNLENTKLNQIDMNKSILNLPEKTIRDFAIIKKVEPEIITPVKKDFKAKDPKLKYKGIKKKNITL